jgi:tetratricopeptide (TPR) repeat protein
MQFDPNNKVVQLCHEGMNAAAIGNITAAHELFLQAWEVSTNALEAVIAAHFFARHQADQEDALKWNLEALNNAHNVKRDDIKGFYPSLYLNVGKAYEDLNNLPAAIQHYQLAAAHSNELPESQYSAMIKTGISNGLKRTGATGFNPPVLNDLINKWCDTKHLQPLSLVLPVYLANLGTNHCINKLISALSYLSATRCLDAADQEKTDQLIETLSSSLQLLNAR